MARPYSQPQQDYFLARAVADEANAVLAQRMAPHAGLLDDEATIERYCDIEAGHRTELGLLRIERELRMAEQALVDWVFATVEKDSQSAPAFAAHRDELAHLRQTTSVKVRAQLIDLALRLNAP